MEGIGWKSLGGVRLEHQVIKKRCKDHVADASLYKSLCAGGCSNERVKGVKDILQVGVPTQGDLMRTYGGRRAAG